jgi:ABC-2 type transport system permease protein
MRSDAAHRLAVLVRHNLLLRLRDPRHLISYVVMPMALMVAFEPLYGRLGAGGETQTVIGMLVMFSTLSVMVVGTGLLTERIWQTWDRLRVTPASVTELLLGKAIPVFGLLLCQQTLLIVFGTTVVGMRIAAPLALVGLAVLVWSCTLVALGSLLAVLVRSHGELSAASDVGALTLSILGGAFAPVATMPAWLQVIAPFSPGYWAITLYHAAVDNRVGTALTATAILGAVTLLAATLAWTRVNRGLAPLRG